MRVQADKKNVLVQFSAMVINLLLSRIDKELSEYISVMVQSSSFTAHWYRGYIQV